MSIRPQAPRPEPPPLPTVFFAQDHPPWFVAERVRSNQWERVTRGAYLGRDATASQQALARIVAVQRRTAGVHWFSHESAALLWGLPLREPPETSHLYQLTRPSSKADASVFRHVKRVEPEDQAIVNDISVTGLCLTAADCLRTFPPLGALVIADGALRAGADPSRIQTLLATGRGRVRARAVTCLADAGAESSARFHLLAAGLPVPQTQVQVDTDHGVYWADLGYPQWRVLIEYDGQEKYSNPRAFLREKERHEAIEAQGWRIIRLTRKDLRDPARLVRRVTQVLPPGLPLFPRPYLTH
ncbi:MAG: endonuclease domain-containing protein [Micrococcales bacterium]|nr:endonuclease domain-containing protein [Micrococcales bacterium]